MYEWQRQIQYIVDEIDRCIAAHEDEALTLRHLARSCMPEISRNFRVV